MTRAVSSPITGLLQRINAGETQAAEDLLPVVYTELRRLARSRMAHEAAGHTLQPTALVHEAYLRLVGDADPGWQNRAHFFAAAAEAMRRILIERARRIRRDKRGGGLVRVSLSEADAHDPAAQADLIDIDDALTALEAQDAQMAAVVKLRYFAGLDVEETARALGISARTVNRAWTGARAWLLREVGNRARAAR
jgi:RNA polymerase sigma factor (TIGR02999 family)